MISVVIPTHNEEKAIGSVLDELIEVFEGQSYEIIVVDDGSTANIANVAQEKDFVKLIQHPQNRGYGAAIKTGIKNAKGDSILITTNSFSQIRYYEPAKADVKHTWADIGRATITSHNIEVDLDVDRIIA